MRDEIMDEGTISLEQAASWACLTVLLLFELPEASLLC
jgi:hypothetical protein